MTPTMQMRPALAVLAGQGSGQGLPGLVMRRATAPRLEA
jgi:hypothetical protein